MKKIGMIGGLGWLSTIDYYRLLCAKTNAHYENLGVEPPLPTPHIFIESLNMHETRMLRGKEGDDASWAGFENVFREAFGRLEAAGAEFGIIASNTPHMRIKGITKDLGFPVVSILDATAQAVRDTGAKRALVLGTTVTMNSTVYADTMYEYGIDTFSILPEAEIDGLGKLIDYDLYQGRCDTAMDQIVGLCKKYVQNESDVVCLACTELPLAFPRHTDSTCFEEQGITFVNTTVAHVDAALARALTD
ncbi:amino acid racemase [Gammaproteobacteria bacterium]|nr:amino acid racemase [Gammaproteobacteria bacterium]